MQLLLVKLQSLSLRCEGDDVLSVGRSRSDWVCYGDIVIMGLGVRMECRDGAGG